MKTKPTNYWISYSDLMAGLLFILFAIIVISNFQYKQKLKVIGENIDLRANIAKELQKQFNKENVNSVEVDTVTGNIEFIDSDELVWFNVNEAILLPEGKKILSEVLPIYISVLLENPQIREKLDRIIIEGHASLEADIPERYLKDLELSEARAHSVGVYILENFGNQYQLLKEHLVTLGRSFADANYPGRTNPFRQKDRKVVFRYTLKYEQMMRELIKMDSQ